MPEVVKPNIGPSPAANLVRPERDCRALVTLLNEWMQGDEQEQKETFEFLRQALDEGRPEGSKLFP